MRRLSETKCFGVTVANLVDGVLRPTPLMLKYYSKIN
jgi:hypothetical protein